MIFWTKNFPRNEQLLALWRYNQSHKRFFDRPYFRFQKNLRPKLKWKSGYRRVLALLKDSLKDKPCIIAGAGPSLAEHDFALVNLYPVITCNGAYKVFNQHGITPDYFLMEDIDQVEKRRREWPKIQAQLKLAALHNSYAIKPDKNTVFFNTSRHIEGVYFWEDEPRPFSRDFASIAYLGGTIVYLMLQLAYHLGCNPVYIIGLDHTYKFVIEELGIKEINHFYDFRPMPDDHRAFLEQVARYTMGALGSVLKLSLGNAAALDPEKLALVIPRGGPPLPVVQGLLHTHRDIVLPPDGVGPRHVAVVTAATGTQQENR